MPVFWFSLSFVDSINIWRTILVFIILHVLVYPSSNGYNSFMDKDEGSIGGIENPLPPTKQLLKVTLLLDALAVALSFFISPLFALCIGIYITFSRLYSYRGIRLKKFPVWGYLTVIFNQGSLTFFMVYHAADENLTIHMPLSIVVAAAFLIGGFYPVTQVYQHHSDARDGVTTISMLMGKKGTFILCAMMYAIAMLLLYLYFQGRELYWPLFVIIIFFIPVATYFITWFLKVLKNRSAADYKHTMAMNWIASTCTNLAFITIILIKKFG